MPHGHDQFSPQHVQQRLVAERRVRAVAQAGSYGTAFAWSGSQPGFVVFERGLTATRVDVRAGVTVERYPLESLERWQDWPEAQRSAPLALLATSRVAYDPDGGLTRVQKVLHNLNAAQLATYRQELLSQATTRLEDMRQVQVGASGAGQALLVLMDARDVALNLLYPALLTHLHLWPEFEIRLPHAWRASVGLRFPKATDRLEQLYAFGGEPEARRVLLATRGLGLVEQERRARLAFQSGYYDGAVRLLRDEAARTHRADVLNWLSLTPGRREKLGTLLGVTRAPLGAAALQVVQELLVHVREGQ